MVRWVIGSIRHGENQLCYFSFQPVLHDLCNKGCGMYYPVCGMVHIKEPLLLIGKSNLCGNSRFPLSLYEWSLPYVWCHITVNKTFPSFLLPRSYTSLLLRLWYVNLFTCCVRVECDVNSCCLQDVDQGVPAQHGWCPVRSAVRRRQLALLLPGLRGEQRDRLLPPHQAVLHLLHWDTRTGTLAAMLSSSGIDNYNMD